MNFREGVTDGLLNSIFLSTRVEFIEGYMDNPHRLLGRGMNTIINMNDIMRYLREKVRTTASQEEFIGMTFELEGQGLHLSVGERSMRAK